VFSSAGVVNGKAIMLKTAGGFFAMQRLVASADSVWWLSWSSACFWASSPATNDDMRNFVAVVLADTENDVNFLNFNV
jgi:hypothetical protein